MKFKLQNTPEQQKEKPRQTKCVSIGLCNGNIVVFPVETNEQKAAAFDWLITQHDYVEFIQDAIIMNPWQLDEGVLK